MAETSPPFSPTRRSPHHACDLFELNAGVSVLASDGLLQTFEFFLESAGAIVGFDALLAEGGERFLVGGGGSVQGGEWGKGGGEFRRLEIGVAHGWGEAGEADSERNEAAPVLCDIAVTLRAAGLGERSLGFGAHVAHGIGQDLGTGEGRQPGRVAFNIALIFVSSALLASANRSLIKFASRLL